MSDDQPTNDPRDLFPPVAPPAAAPSAPPGDLFAASPVPPSGSGDEWNAAAPKKGVRMPVPVLVALVAIVALLGLWGGAQLKGDSSSASAATTGQGARRGRGYFNGGTGTPGQGGAGGRGVFGTVASVDGDTITLTTADGSTVKVTVGSGTTISKSATAAVSDIKAGDTLVVRGTTTDGTTQATSINIGGVGGFGGFGPGGGPGGAPGAPGQDQPPAAAN